MLPIDVIAFGVTLAFALIVLIKWKRRRMIIARRVNRGLKGYVLGGPILARHASSVPDPEEDEELSVA
jgi:hypothetical protein